MIAINDETSPRVEIYTQITKIDAVGLVFLLYNSLEIRKTFLNKFNKLFPFYLFLFTRISVNMD